MWHTLDGYWYMMNYAWMWISMYIVVILTLAFISSRRDENTFLWVLLFIFFPMMSIFVYLIYIVIQQPEESKITTTPETNQTNNTSKYCSECGAMNPRIAKFCTECGTTF